VLARREHDLADRNHALFADGFPDHGERLLADRSVISPVIARSRRTGMPVITETIAVAMGSFASIWRNQATRNL
jgi:hypothetical protein